MRNFKLLLSLFTLIVLFSCGDKEDEVIIDYPPSKSQLLYPEQEASDISLSPTFRWRESVDPEKKEVIYELYLSENDSFDGNLVAKAVDIHSPSYTFNNITLERLKKYYWRVIAYDAKKNKVESDVFSFTTIDEDIKLELLSPQNGVTLEGNETIIKWQAQKREGYDKEVTFSVFLRNRSDEFSTPLKSGITETQIHLSDLKGNGTYYWEVKAIDDEDNALVHSEIYSFKVPNTIPTPARILKDIKQNIEENKVNVTFKWAASMDPDRILDNGSLRPEKLTYDFYLSTSGSFSENDIKMSGVEDLTYTERGLDYNTDYWVKVVTKDENGGIAESEVVMFTTKTEPISGDFTLEEGEWTDSRDNKTYKTVTINGKTWLAENFAYIPYVEEMDDDGNKKICSVFGVDSSNINDLKSSENYTQYGVLYSVYAFTDIVPDGWHVATDDDWKELEQLSGMDESQINSTGYRNRGTTMHKFIALEQPYEGVALTPTNEMGTSIKYGGYYKDASFNGGFRGVQEYTYIWTSTAGKQLFTTGNFFRAFSKKRKGVERGVQIPKYRMYVRLVKD